MSTLLFENGSSLPDDELPSEEQIKAWFDAALPKSEQAAEVCLRLMDPGEIQELNRQYRNKNSPTNVLSFPCTLPEGVDSSLLGDLAICPQIVKREAAEQKKPEPAHWAHMIVHGTLHLLGYDHIKDEDAAAMENLEIHILAGLGFANPYQYD